MREAAQIAAAGFVYLNRSECVGNMSLDEILTLILGTAPTEEQSKAADMWISDYHANNTPAPPTPAVVAATPERYDARFYPHGSTQVHYTANVQYKLGEDSVVTALCGKQYSRFMWAENIHKRVCPACLAADAKLTQHQIDAVVWSLDGQSKDHADAALVRLAAAFNFRRERFVWCNPCTAYRPAGHDHYGTRK